uniref:NADPH:quinone reductase n=1 Tax=Opuntia streptacantha TaxID=393608 RepID=A0A7C9CLQ6_OPUST
MGRSVMAALRLGLSLHRHPLRLCPFSPTTPSISSRSHLEFFSFSLSSDPKCCLSTSVYPLLNPSSSFTKLLVRAFATSAEASSPSSSSSRMVKAIRVHEFGGPEVLKWEDVEIGEPKEGEVRVRNRAIGLNFIDVYFRKGVYKAPSMPFTPGMEAVGEVVAVGPGLTGRQVGDLVAYAGHPLGSYAEEQILPADKVVPLPSSVSPIIAASVMLKGLTAHYLVRRCFKVEAGHTVLVHAAAGGVGSLLCQWANALGATVIGTVSTEEKAIQAKEDGCHHVIIYKEEDFVTRVNEITSGQGVEVVYDSVGKDTFQLDMVRLFGGCYETLPFRVL